jgi:carboxylesterase type B
LDRAIIQSITCTFRERDAALAQGEAIASSLGCTDPATVVACLRGKDTLALLQAWQGDARPVVGGSALPQAPMTAIDAGDYNRVPVIWGNTLDEFSFVILGNPDMTQDELRTAIARRYPTHVEAILAEYADARSPAWAYSAVVSDPFICGMNDQAGRLSRSTLVWYYEWNDQDPPPEVGITMNLGAYHSGELQYLYGFSTRTDGTPKQSRGLDAAERRLSTEMIAYWGRLRGQGQPQPSRRAPVAAVRPQRAPGPALRARRHRGGRRQPLRHRPSLRLLEGARRAARALLLELHPRSRAGRAGRRLGMARRTRPCPAGPTGGEYGGTAMRLRLGRARRLGGLVGAWQPGQGR